MRKQILIAMAAVALTACTSRAVDRHWANTGTDFNAGASWSGGTAPGTSDRAFFSTAMSSQPDVSASTSLYGLFFTPALGTAASAATSACGGYVLTAAPGAALTLTASGYNYNGVYMLEQCTTGSNIIATPIAFPVKTTESHHFVNVVSGTLEFSGPLTGDSNNVLRVGGTAKFPAFILSGDNSGFTGGFVKAGGFPVIIRNSKALSKTTRFELSVHGAQPGESNRLINASGGPLVFENNPRIFLNGGDTHYLISDHPIDFGSGTVAFNDGYAGRSAPLAIFAPLVKIGGPAIQTGGTNGYDKLGPGTLEIGGASSYLRETRISDGVFLARHPEAFSPLSALNITKHSASVSGGILGLAYGDFTNSIGTTAGCFYSQNSGGYGNWGGWAAYGANRNVNIGNNLQAVTNIFPFLANITLGSATADATVTFLNPLHTQDSTWYAYDGAAEVDGRFAGAITNYNGASKTISKRGDGTLELTAVNPFAGSLNIYDGELRVTGSTGPSLSINVKAGGALSGAGTMAGNITVESNGVFRINSALATGALGKNLILNDGARMDVVLGGGNGVGYVLEGSSQRLWNYGAVVCNVSTLDEDVTSGSFTLMNWSGATTPDISKLNAANFSIANPEDFSGVFAIEGDALVLHYRNLALKPLLIVVR